MPCHTLPCPHIANLRALSIQELEELQNPSQPNHLDRGVPHTAAYASIHAARKLLPVYNNLPAIGQAIVETQVVVVSSPTGSGKSTQVPQYCTWMIGHCGCPGKIYETQPSDIATASGGRRLQIEFDSENVAGFQYQGHRCIPDPVAAAVIVMTDGTLERMTKADGDLSEAAMVIIHEVHEVSKDRELLLGSLHLALKQRPDLRIVLMSATARIEPILEYFSEFSPQAIQLEGQPHYLQRIFLSPQETEQDCEVIVFGMLGMIFDKPIHGDVLVFLDGEGPIRQLYGRLVNQSLSEAQQARTGLVEYLMLFRDLPLEDQDRITIDRFDESGVRYRKVILATQVAETSITLKNVTVTIDTGRNEMVLFDPEKRGAELLPVPISRAQADQRAGRAGRRQAGIALACFTKDEYDSLPAEGMRPLKSADLTLHVLKILAKPNVAGDLRKFKWFTTPDPRQLIYAIGRLGAHGMLRSDSDLLLLTDDGQVSADLDIAPELAKLFISVKPEDGNAPSGAYEILVLIALRAVGGSISAAAMDDTQEAIEARTRYSDTESEHFGLVNLWLAWAWHHKKQQSVKFAEKMFLHQGQCLKVRDRLNALVKVYNSLYQVKLKKPTASTVTLTVRRFQELLWNSHIMNRAVLHNPLPPTSSIEKYRPVWRSTIVDEGRYIDEELLIRKSTQFYDRHPVYVVFSEIRLHRLANNDVLQIMDLITSIPADIAQATSDTMLPPSTYGPSGSNQRGSKRPLEQ